MVAIPATTSNHAHQALATFGACSAALSWSWLDAALFVLLAVGLVVVGFLAAVVFGEEDFAVDFFVLALETLATAFVGLAISST